MYLEDVARPPHAFLPRPWAVTQDLVDPGNFLQKIELGVQKVAFGSVLNVVIDLIHVVVVGYRHVGWVDVGPDGEHRETLREVDVVGEK